MGLERKGPGLLLRDLDRGDDPAITAALAVIARLDADILVLAGVDHDPALHALSALERLLRQSGQPYPHRYAPRPNSGQPSGRDLDADGRMNEAEDALGWGPFPGAGGLAILSRLPLLVDEAQDHSAFLWRDLPGADLPPGPDAALLADLPLASRSHVSLPVGLPGGGRLALLIWHATPPVFDGPEDRNGRRNADEAAFWLHLLDGRLPGLAPPATPFVLLGDANLDPVDGEGRPWALNALLAHPALTDPRPRGNHGRHDPGQSGDPALDTALYRDLGGLRLEYVLPSRDLPVLASGVLWPADDDPLAATLRAASHHYPVWVDISAPAP
ncbi:MAG: endonuclease/exonuclease/phosphatase family protein [Paracoccaceae bacterium]